MTCPRSIRQPDPDPELFAPLASTGVAVPGTIELAADGLSAVYRPAALLEPLTGYRVTASNTITDLAGNWISGRSNFFTTGP